MDNNFSEFWIKMFNYNVFRMQKIGASTNKIGLGSPQESVIIQVIAWHHYLSSITEVNNEVKSFEDTLKLWSKHKYNKTASKKLTITLLCNLTNIPFETARRKISKLVKKKYITYTKSEGLRFIAESELNKIIVNEIHPYEKELLVEFLVSFLLSGKENN